MTNRLLAATLGAGLGAATAGAALANDSTAELRTGGLVLTRHAGIAMKAEDLFISEQEIRVDYRFLNTTARDLKVIVAFPMPDLNIEGIDDQISIPGKDPENLLDFHTTVEGAPVRAHVEQKAVRGGVDRTVLLKRLGVPVAPQLQATRDALDKLPKSALAELRRLGMTEDDDFDAGKGWEHHLAPHWTLKTTYWWEQTFPAGRELRVSHRYKPSVGASAGTSLEIEEFYHSKEYRQYERQYCLDAGFLGAVKRAKTEAGPQTQAFFEKRIAYILKSGANWKEPIGDFHLTIDKGKADSLVSFCADGVKKTGPTRFEVRHQNFTPTRDLSILILERLAKE